jgi:hypothetical protein
LLINVSEYFILFFVSDKCSTLSLPYITEPWKHCIIFIRPQFQP